ncbi:MAG: PHP domain-containing protein [Chloroflexota bacterium]|nr:MAG: PHP domain-containing protein [Chloroflexota bacterium]
MTEPAPGPGACDLHLHTYYSDGRSSPEELLRHAAQMGLKCIAITDHDNTRGVREVLPLADLLGIELIPAIEFTCRWDGKLPKDVEQGDIDVLGYYIDLDNREFRLSEKAALDDLHARITDCCQVLSEAGYPVSIEDAFEQNPRYGGAAQVIQALWRKGQVDRWESAIPLFESTWRRVRSSRFSIENAIDVIHAAGGAAVLAHPSVIRSYRGWLRSEHIEALAAMGLDGIEVFHHRLKPEARAHFTSLARRYDLIITGGSDEHGWPEGFPRLGGQAVPLETSLALKERALNRAANHEQSKL